MPFVSGQLDRLMGSDGAAILGDVEGALALWADEAKAVGVDAARVSRMSARFRHFG